MIFEDLKFVKTKVFGQTLLTGVAQLAEQRSPKPQVVGSSPTARAHGTLDLGGLLLRVKPGKSKVSLFEWPDDYLLVKDTQSILDRSRLILKRIVMANIGNYLEEVGKEMRKVTWPSQKELINHTIVTIVATVVISLFIFSTDQIISTVLEVIYG